MFDCGLLESAASGPATLVRTCHGLLRGLVRGSDGEVGTRVEAELVETLTALEELKSAAAAAQARVAAELDRVVRHRHTTAGLPAAQQGRGVAAQVALARRVSPYQGGRHLGLAQALVREMPHTLRLLDEGHISEWRATLLVQETACLTREDRATVDQALCADPAVVERLGDRALAARARTLAWRLDPGAARRRHAKAERDRRVSLRPAPDTMSRLSALLGVPQGVAVYAALSRAADEARGTGDTRTRGQVMADTLVERVTGKTGAGEIPVQVHLVMTDRALFAGDQEPAHLMGYGPVPATAARAMVRPEPESKAGFWLRRLYTHPTTGELVAMDSKARAFPTALRQFLVLRDQTCRTPWCDAPVRHADHARSRIRGGRTSAGNGQGLCEACNYAKESPGWSAGPATSGDPRRHVIATRTPTGHRYESRPPPQPGWAGRSVSHLEVVLSRFLAEFHAA